MKKLLLYSITLLCFLYSKNIFSQEKIKIGIHQEQSIEFGNKEKTASKFDVSGKDIIPLQKSQAKALSKIVFGFLPDWEYNSGAHNNMHYDLLTHIAAFNFKASSSGAIANPSGWPWTDVINAAHGAGTKVIMTVNNFSASEINTLLTNNTSKNNLFNNIKNTISTYQLDGVNIDFEGLNSSDRGSILNSFLSDLTNFIHTELPGKEVSFDGPAVNWSGWNLDGLAQSVDHVFIMAYDYNGGWSTNTGAVSPLTHPSGGICLTKTLSNDYSIPKSNYPEKLILGVPYYGKHWKTSTSSAGSSVTSYVGSTFYRSTVTDAVNHGGFIWDNNSQTPWYRWSSGGWNQIWADNETSLSKKYDLALTENLGGVGIWALNYDGNRSELWDLINTKFGGGTTPSPSAPKSVAAIRKDATTITLKFEAGNHAEGYKVYQSTNNTSFTMVKDDTSTSIDITNLQQGEVYYFKIESYNNTGTSGQTDVLSAMPSLHNSDILIIDGVERRNIDAIVQYDYPLTQLNRTFSSASNEAIINNIVDLKDFKFVIWMLLDESTADDTFNKTEQTRVKDFIDNNGVFIVSGDEIGWDLGNSAKADAEDMTFYANYLKAEYIADLPSPLNHKVKDNNNVIYNLDNGTQGFLAIDYPDVIKAINGSQKTFEYDGVSSSSGYAGISYETTTGGVDYLGFAIEAVYNDTERKDLIDYLLSKYNSLLAVDDSFIKTNINIYPNPTNGILNISNPNHIKLNKIEVYNIYGQRLKIVQNQNNIDLTNFKPGVYLMKVEDENGKQGTFKVIKH